MKFSKNFIFISTFMFFGLFLYNDLERFSRIDEEFSFNDEGSVRLQAFVHQKLSDDLRGKNISLEKPAITFRFAEFSECVESLIIYQGMKKIHVEKGCETNVEKFEYEEVSDYFFSVPLDEGIINRNNENLIFGYDIYLKNDEKLSSHQGIIFYNVTRPQIRSKFITAILGI